MPRGLTIKQLRKAGAFVGGDLAAGQIGVNISDKRLAFSTDGADVQSLSATPGQVEKVAFAAAGTIPVIFTAARTLSAPTVRASSGTPVLTYTYSATGTGTFTAVASFPHLVAVGSTLLVTCTDMSTATWVGVAIPTS